MMKGHRDFERFEIRKLSKTIETKNQGQEVNSSEEAVKEGIQYDKGEEIVKSKSQE